VLKAAAAVLKPYCISARSAGELAHRRTGCRVVRLSKDHNVCAICLGLEHDQATLMQRIKGSGG
jgi:hypothetical protein